MTKTMIKTIKALGLSLAPLLLGGVGGGLSSCQREDFNDGPTAPTAQQEIAFNTMVPSSQMATRADATIVNWKQTSLPPTEEHTYYRVDESGRVVAEEKEFYAGLFGCYTGPYRWEELVALSLKPSRTTEEEDILKQYYSANQLYNVKANIGTAASGGNTLTYSPIHLWPNDGKYMTFWGYYPYNPASAQGDYGIAIVNDENGVGEGKGMGKVHFTMHPDASQQNDFLISAPSVDCTREQYPLQLNSSGSGYSPKPVRLSLYHMLAQVRIYAYVTGADKLVYKEDEYYAEDDTYVDEYGMSHTVTAEEAGKIKKIDEANSVRWKRTDIECYGGTRMRADIEYSLEFNNIKTEADFFPDYNPSGTTIGYETANTLGYATINHYIMNPYWFTYKGTKRERLNDNYMFGFYEDTPAYHRLKGDEKMSGYDDIDGVDWSNTTMWPADNQDPLSYMTGMGDYKKLLAVSDAPDAKHYNFAPGNTLLVVPQRLSDDDVPHVVITAKGKRRVWNESTSSWEDGEELTAKVTINMLKMGIKWESGFIYCYAFLDELMPGDDKVRGPESITVVFDTNQYTDQW
jgi:hypothetical protein